MTTPRSGKSTANHFVDHPEDIMRRELLKTDLITLRRAGAVSSHKILSQRAGHGDNWLYELEQRACPRNWLFNSLYDWGRVVGVDIWVVPELNPVLPEDKISPLTRVGITMASMSGVGLMAYMKDWRVFHGITQKHIAEELNVVHSTMWSIEESTNPKISTMQRYARVLGGKVAFHVEPIKPKVMEPS